MNIIPYLGPFIGATFGVIIVVSANLDVSFYQVLLPKILKLLAVFASMQLLDNFILQPNIFSKSVKAHPLEIFIIVLVGAKIGGVVGMILAIPAYTVLRVLAKVFLSEFKVVQRITQNL
jgi:predicted PurR-regulated permease PerM